MTLKCKTRAAVFCLLALLLLALPPLAAACGGDDDKDKTPAAEEKWITIGSSHVLTGAPASSAHVTFTGAMELINYINEVEGGIDTETVFRHVIHCSGSSILCPAFRSRSAWVIRGVEEAHRHQKKDQASCSAKLSSPAFNRNLQTNNTPS